ncbi:carboxypeptidase [Fusarium bulbicola]|nr:carboxypeptidase [Fusarium bulbicola]
MHSLVFSILLSGAAALSYAGNKVPFEEDPPQIAANFPDVDQKLYSPAFMNPDNVAPGFANGTSAPNSQQTLEQFLWTLASRNEWMTYHNPVFTSEEGRSIPYVVLSSSKSLLQTSLVGNTTNKVRVWLQGGVHGNEPAGEEGLLALLGKMDAEPEWALGLLEKLDVIVLPRYNPDGSAYFQRLLATSFDPNRDHTNMASQQTMEVKQLNLKFNAHVHLDCHEYGARRGLTYENKTYIPAQDNQFSAFKNPNVHADIRISLRMAMLLHHKIIVRDQPRWMETTWPYLDAESGNITEVPVLLGNNTPPASNLTRARPDAYIFSRAWANAALRLRAAGVVVDEFAVDFEGEVEAYNITSATLADTKYEGIALTTVNTELSRKMIKFPAGAYWVGTKQQHAAQAFVRLEPESPDGFATFNILPVNAGDEYQVYRIPSKGQY